MTNPVARRLLTELFAGQRWPAEGEQLLHQSLGPRSPVLLLEAPGWLGLDTGQLVLEAGCRDATHAIALARRYRCRVLGVDLVPAWLPKGRAEVAAAGLATQIGLVQGDLEALPVADRACDLVWSRDVLLILAWGLGFTGALVLRWTRPSSARNDRAMNVEAINIDPSDAIQALASGLRPPIVSTDSGRPGACSAQFASYRPCWWRIASASRAWSRAWSRPGPSGVMQGGDPV
jgi:SAM-dependent methyltransferase